MIMDTDSRLGWGVLDEIGMGTLVLGPDGVVLRANRWFLDAAGRTFGDVHQRTLVDAFPHLRGSRLMGAVAECLEKGRAGYLTHALNQELFPLYRGSEDGGSDSRVVRQLVRITSIELPGGERGALVQIQDTTESHVREQLLRKMTEELEHRVEERTAALRQAQKMEAVGQLAGGVAHDFNNLLMVIMGHLELLEDVMEDDPRVVWHIEMLRQAATGGAEVAGRLLSFSRRERRSPRRVDLNASIENILGLLGRTIGEHVTLKPEFAEGLPEVEMDVGQLHNAVVNVAINARDAMPGGGTITLRTVLHRPSLQGGRFEGDGLHDPTFVRLEIADTGSGIPGEILDRVLEPFFTTKDDGKGSGLGLAMVDRFVEDSGGRLDIESSVGEGTVVRMDFPVHEAPHPEVGGGGEDERVHQGGHERILVVENEEGVRDLIREMLYSMGYEPITVGNPAEALKKLARHAESVDMVLSDVVMPGGMTGLALREEVSHRYSDVPVLLMSGYVGDGPPVDAEVEGNILWKPFTRSTLAAAIRATLSSSLPAPH